MTSKQKYTFFIRFCPPQCAIVVAPLFWSHILMDAARMPPVVIVDDGTAARNEVFKS